jgi:hypothetical protein
MTFLKVTGEKRHENLDQLLVFLELMKRADIARNMLNEAIKKHSKNTEGLLKKAEEIIEREIYGYAGNTSKRTGNLLESILVGENSNEDYPLTVGSDPLIAPAIAGQDAYQYSYLGFFEDPSFGEGSFIPPRDDNTAPSRYRPFMEFWNEELSKEFTDIVHREVNSLIKSRMPRKG